MRGHERCDGSSGPSRLKEKARGLLPAGLKFLSVSILRDLFTFPIDMLPVAAEPNRLNDQVLVRYYENEWKVIAR